MGLVFRWPLFFQRTQYLEPLLPDAISEERWAVKQIESQT